MTDDKLSSKLTQNLLEILNDEEYYDVTIEKNDGILEHVKLPNISPEIFQIILSYIYRGKISLEECDTSDIIKILSAAYLLKTFLNLLDTNSKPNDKSRPRLNNDELSHLPETIDNENTKKRPQLYSESTSSSRYLEQPDEQPDKETAWGSWGPKNSQQSDEESAWDSWKPKNSQQPDEETAWGSWGPKNSQQPDGGSNRKINEASTCGSREPKNFQRPDGGSNRHRPRNSQRPDGGSNRHRPRNSQQFDGGSNRRGGYGRNGPRYSQQPDDEWW
ncbi:unnamed protein product [Rhizophagus irregularis]|nr:unnamed protein product [Rhizophagus irregularis]